MQKRCAYFGCMHPLFESDDGRRKYCSDQCCRNAMDRSENTKRLHKAYDMKIAADPVLSKKKANRAAKSNYERMSATGKLPPWMKS